MEKDFKVETLKKLYKPKKDSSGEDNGQVSIIGGSELFHGAPLLSLKVASRLVDMVFFSTPEKSVGHVAENLKSKLLSFIWVPWEDVENYLEKSDSILIGPGFMRFRSEKVPHGKRNHLCDEACRLSRSITEKFLKDFKHKKWVIDAGSLQTMDPEWIPEGSVLTPNKKEFRLLFGKMRPEKAAKKYKCVIVLKGPVTKVYWRDDVVKISNGNPGLTKGGTGDIMAGLTVGLLAKNEPFLAAQAAGYLIKAAGDDLYKRVGTSYNADDLTNILPEVFFKSLS
jgi:NAD(P)H-hydrate epimerase